MHQSVYSAQTIKLLWLWTCEAPQTASFKRPVAARLYQAPEASLSNSSWIDHLLPALDEKGEEGEEGASLDQKEAEMQGDREIVCK